MHRCKQKQPKILQDRTCWQQVQIRSASKALFHFLYIISLFVQQTCQNIARIMEISSMSLVHRMHGWAIPQDNRILLQIWSYKTTEKLLQSSK